MRILFKKCFRLIATQFLIFNITRADIINHCIDWDFNSGRCPSSSQTQLRCLAPKLPLYSDTTANFTPSVTNPDYTSSSLVILPGMTLQCIIYCYSSLDDPVANSNCMANYFTTDPSPAGSISDKQQGIEPSTIVFLYWAPNFDSSNINGGTDTFSIVYDGDAIKGNPVNVIFPEMVSTESQLTCEIQYVLVNSYVKCFIQPKNTQGISISGTPFMFEVILGTGYNNDYGNFGTNGYVAPAEQNEEILEFQYKAGTKPGCNYIQVLLSKNLPSDAAVGQNIKGSNIKICTISENEGIFATASGYALPFVLIAIIHTISAIL